jgi:hypothetical protein
MSETETVAHLSEQLLKLTAEAAKYRDALQQLASYAATCQQTNEPEWMSELVRYLNESFKALGDDSRFKMVRVIPAGTLDPSTCHIEKAKP